ncbi:MAG: branched-chain amino acid ABC transporter permease [Alphaproteobacteria bacterium]
MSVQSTITPGANPANSIRLAGITLPMWRKLWLIGFIVLVIAIPFIVKNFTIFQFTLAAIYAIAILGLNLLTGFNGQFSLGHSAFYALGAYTMAIMMDNWPIMAGDYEVTFLVGLFPVAIVCLVAGFLFGLPALRLDGLYLALATFALAVATPQLLKYNHFEEFTGGVQGINLLKPESAIGFLNDDQFTYFYVMIVLGLLFLGAWNLIRGRTGRAMVAIRDNPLAAKAMGINTALYKSGTFGVSAMYTGIAGALSALAIEYVAPDSFTFILAVSFLVGLVVGGVASIPGAIVGGLFILFIPNFAEEVSKGLSWAVYGAFLILAVYVMPTGAAGLVRIITHRLIRISR